MDTMRSSLKRGREVWDPINMPPIEFQRRVERIRTEMKKQNIDVLLLYGTSPDHYGNPSYVSNCFAKLPSGMLIAIPQNEETVYFYEGNSRDVPEVKTTMWIEQIRPASDISTECIKFLTEKKLIPSSVGLAGVRELMPYYQSHVLLEALSRCNIADFGHFMRSLRTIKSERESDQIRRASRILSQTFAQLIDNAQKNINERHIEAITDKTMRMEGAEDCRILIARPQERKWAFRPAEDRSLSPKSSIIIYLAVEFERYWSESIKTFVAMSTGLIPPNLDNAQALYQRIMRSIKPGKTISQFYKDTMKELKEERADYVIDYGLGGGIGLSLQEYPAITEGEASQFKAGMCLAFRLAMRHNKMGVVTIGNTIHLSADGTEVLTM